MITEDLAIPRATVVTLSIMGQWSPFPKRGWRGIAAAPEPVVGVSFLRCGNHLEWCISERPTGNTIEVRLALFPFDKGNLDVGVNVFIGKGGRRWRSTVPSPTYRPEIPQIAEARTGKVTFIARVDGNPTVDFLGLFLVRRDIKCGRNGIWHLRTELLDAVPSELVPMLTYGRAGRVAEAK